MTTPEVVESSFTPKDRRSVIAEIKKSFGHQSLTLASDDEAFPSKGVIPTGIVPLDAFLGGGIPRGRFIELYGTQGHGKTTLALEIAIQCQNLLGEVIYFDAEHSLDTGRSNYIGLDLTRMCMLNPDPFTIEQVVTELIENVKKFRAKGTNGPILFIWDTLANTPHGLEAKLVGMTVEEQKKQKYSEGMNPRPQLIRAQLRKLTHFIAENDVTIIFINHLIQNLRPYGEQQITTGGDALKYAASIRFKVKRKEPMKDDDDLVFGFNTEVELTKSKVCTPWRTVAVPLVAEDGFNKDVALLDALIREADERYPVKKAPQSGHCYVDIGGKKITFAYPTDDRKRIKAAHEAFFDNPGLYEYLSQKAFELLAPPWWKTKNLPKAEEAKAEPKEEKAAKDKK